MPWNQGQFDEALKKKYEIQQQNADSDTTKANAASQNVAQQQALQQQAEEAAQRRAEIASQTQLKTTEMNNQTTRAGQDQNYSLGQAQNGLEAAKYASQDQVNRAVASAGSTVDQATGRVYSNAATFKTPSYMDQYLKNFPVRSFGPASPTSPSPSGLGPSSATRFGLNWPDQLQGYRNGGTPPTNQPFVVGENGPETFIPADGSEPIVVGQHGPTVMTVPKPGFVEPNPQTSQQARASLNQGDTQQPSAQVAQQARASLGGRAPVNYVQVGSGSNPITMREVNLYDAVKQQQAQDDAAAKEAEKNKPEFNPQDAIDYAKNLSPDDRKKFWSNLPQNQLDSVNNYRTQINTLSSSPHQTGLSFIPVDQARQFAQSKGWTTAPVAAHGQAASPEEKQKIDAAMAGAVESGDATYNPGATYNPFPPDFKIEGSVSRLLSNRRAAMQQRTQEMQAEDDAMKAKQAAMARRALGLGSYFVTAPDTAIYR